MKVKVLGYCSGLMGTGKDGKDGKGHEGKGKEKEYDLP